jgi:hypothetical protein
VQELLLLLHYKGQRLEDLQDPAFAAAAAAAFMY